MAGFVFESDNFSFYISVPLVAIVAGSVFAAIIIVAVLLIVWKYCGAKRKRSSSYEQIIPNLKKHSSCDGVSVSR